MQCPKCGYDNPEDALFCNLCHAVFRKESSKRPEISLEEERYMIMHKHRERGGWKRWLALDVWLSLIVILGIALWASNSVMKREKINEKSSLFKKLGESKINSDDNPPLSESSQLSKRETFHFVIHCNDEKLTDEIVSKVEQYYVIPTDLGLGEGNFWMKGKVHIYIYDTPQEYSQIINRDFWTSGYAEFKTRSIYAYKDVDYLIEAVIPHELTHLIFADFMEFSANYPKWLTEGLAMYEETKYCQAYLNNYQKILDQMKQEKYFTVDALTKIDISKEKRIEVIHFWYVESMSIVTYLIDVYGRGRLYTFCKNLKEGMELNKALENTYSPEIRNLPELSGRWLNYIKTHDQTW